MLVTADMVEARSSSSQPASRYQSLPWLCISDMGGRLVRPEEELLEDSAIPPGEKYKYTNANDLGFTPSPERYGPF